MFAAAFIAAFEGFSATPYYDTIAHVWTIGYGETRRVGPHTPRWTRRQALRHLVARLNGEYGAAVNGLGVPLTRLQRVALVSLAYNVGAGVLDESTGLGRALRARRWRDVPAEILKWDKGGVPLRPVPGLTRRRKAEAALFRRGTRLRRQR